MVINIFNSLSLNPSGAVTATCIPNPWVSTASTHGTAFPSPGSPWDNSFVFGFCCKNLGFPVDGGCGHSHRTPRTSSLWICAWNSQQGLLMKIPSGEAVWANNSREKLEFKSSWMLLALVGPSNQGGNPFSLDTWHNWIPSQHFLPQAVFRDAPTWLLIILI